MKVILIKDVARLGRNREVKEVPDGHALNFLIPRKLAVIATPEGLRRLTEEVKKKDEHKEHALKTFEESLQKLSTETVIYKADANEKGSLFKGINAQDIAAHLSGLGFVISKSNIILEHPIKEIGVHSVGLVHGTAKGTVQLEVVRK